jgi:ABC-type multidrug transport system ATPase subunit
MPDESIIEVKDVWKSFKTVQAVRGVNLTIPRGQFVAILGPNGAGKTTLVEMIEGIRKPDKGEIFIMGKPGSITRMSFTNLSGYLFRKPGLLISSASVKH